MTAQTTKNMPAKKAVKAKAKPAAKKTAPSKKAKKTYSYKKNMALFARGSKVIPQGIYGHFSPALTVPGEYPYYASRADGCRYWDVDGNEFIDYMCGYGPMVIGYNNQQVNRAADKQRALAGCTNHPTPLQVELAERMVNLVPFADWAIFAKNGSDVTTWATLVARDHTRRKKILMARNEYHGAHAWNSPGHNGLIDEDRAHIHLFTWNDLASIRSLVRSYPGQVAAIIMTPYHHPAFGDSELPAPGFWQGVREICDQEGIVLILDDVRAGFRLSIHGSQEYFGFEPDISCYCKAIANGYSISAAVGRDELRVSASKIYATGSYWSSAVEMAAALETIKIIEKTNAIDHMLKIGTTLGEELVQLAEKHGFELKVTGPPSIPNVRFGNETDYYRMQLWATEVTRRGSFFHPHHNWFLSAAHKQADIQQTLNHADDAFKVLKKSYDN